MTDPRTSEFDARWADSNADTTIEVGPEGPEVWVNVGGSTAEVLLSPREAVKLAHALLTIAAGGGIAKQVSVGEQWWTAPDPGPDKTVWLFDTDLLT